MVALPHAGNGVAIEATATVVAYSPDGTVLAAGVPDAVRIFDTRNGGQRHQLAVRTVTALAVSPDATLVAIGLDSAPGPDSQHDHEQRVIVVDATTGRPVKRVPAAESGSITALAFSSNGRMLAGALGTGEVRVWSLAPTGANLRSERLQLTEPELAFLAQLAPLVRTPRAAKRLVNVYRIFRMPLQDNQLDLLLGRTGGTPEHPVVLLLIAIVTGFPDLARAIIADLLTSPAGNWADFLGKYRSRPEAQAGAEGLMWADFFQEYDQTNLSGLPDSIDSFVRWAPFTARFSFRTGRLLA